MSDKIENNSSFEEFRNSIKGAKAIKKIASFLSPISKTAKTVLDAFENFDDLEKQFKEISESPDKFNKYFSELGWIAHESINHDLMLECVQLAECENILSAEEKLADYYTSDEIKWLISSTYVIPEFRTRNELINAAYEDTKANRFHSAIPLLLLIIDGTVNDISKSKGFFAENTDLTAWDSIAAHSTGLSKLRDILNVTRKGTNTEEIFFPYRNGILHGRDISYANKYVAAKSWLTLFAINDWAKVLKRNKENPPKEIKKTTIKESFLELKNTTSKYKEQQLRFKETDNYMDYWKERKPIIGEDFPSQGKLEDYIDFTPEKDAVNFLLNWQKNNYGEIAKQICFFTKDVNFGKEAGKVRKIFENKRLKNFELISIDHKAPAIAEILVKVVILFNQNEYSEELLLRMIYQNEKNENMVYGQSGGTWKFVNSIFFHKIEFVGF